MHISNCEKEEMADNTFEKKKRKSADQLKNYKPGDKSSTWE